MSTCHQLNWTVFVLISILVCWYLPLLRKVYLINISWERSSLVDLLCTTVLYLLLSVVRKLWWGHRNTNIIKDLFSVASLHKQFSLSYHWFFKTDIDLTIPKSKSSQPVASYRILFAWYYTWPNPRINFTPSYIKRNRGLLQFP